MTTIKLYSGLQWKLLPYSLFKVDDIADYLATQQYISKSDFRYVKHGLEIDVTFDMGQKYSQPTTPNFYKYISITNDNENTMYYFIKRTIWKSQNSVKFELVMDVLNSFSTGSDYVFKANTKIIREHKNRLVKGDREINIIPVVASISTTGTISAGDAIELRDTNYPLNDPDGFICNAKFIEFTADNHYIIAIDANENQEHIWDRIAESEGLLGFKKNGFNYISFSVLSWEDDITFSYIMFKNIDYIPENINPLLFHNPEKDVAIRHQDNILRQNWYLLYRNQNQPSDSLVNPVECYLLPEDEINTDYGYITNGRIIPSWLTEGITYYFEVPSGQTFTFSNGATVTIAGLGVTILLLTKTLGKINATCLHIVQVAGTPPSYVAEVTAMADSLDFIDVAVLPANYNQGSPTILNNGLLYSMNYPYEFNNSGAQKILDSVSKLDKTDSRNIKLIKLPYVPYDFTITSNKLQIDANWDLASISQSSPYGPINALKLINLNTKLIGHLVDDGIDIGDTYLFAYNPSQTHPSANDNRSNTDEYESKLFNSEFLELNFVYDSFVFKWELEKLSQNYWYNNLDFDHYGELNITITMTSTINSRFMFTFPDYKLRFSDQNYSDMVVVARNNEEVLYNVPYINYIRSGFNYDVKAKNLAVESSWINTILSGVSIGASLLLPSAPLKVAGVVAGAVSIANSVKSAIVTERQQENSIQAKLQQARMQTASVAGSDDVDLMSEYSGNRLKMMVYEPHEYMKKLIADLFYYCGYTSNRMGIPTHNNRVNFDYLECEPSFERINKNLSDEIMNEIINSFKSGVTFIHAYYVGDTKKWDMAQEKENWEAFIFQEE